MKRVRVTSRLLGQYSLVHDFVLAAGHVTLKKPAPRHAERTAKQDIFGIERREIALSDSSFQSIGFTSNQMLTFPPYPRKLPEAQKTERTEQAP
jgi:hypothetical protein